MPMARQSSAVVKHCNGLLRLEAPAFSLDVEMVSYATFPRVRDSDAPLYNRPSE